MALSTTITPAEIAVALGRSAPVSGSPVEAQWDMWIADALLIVQWRVDGHPTVVEADIDQTVLDYVVREAVVAQVRKPDDSTQVSVSTDDTSVSKTFRSGSGRVGILPEWWELLGLATTKGRAFMVDLMPPGAGIGGDGVTYWWAEVAE
jgi:hypothetical protein